MAIIAHRPLLNASLIGGTRGLVRDTLTLFTMFGRALDAAHEAKRLYRMSGTDLANAGYTPDSIPAAIQARLDGRK